ncbi:MAG: PLP-dependent aminotransferase family protein [Ornithinimicrobium sp.]
MQRVLSARSVAQAVGSADLKPPLYAGLADRIRGAVTDGRLPAGARLPSERELMGAMALSRSTVTRAYQELRDQGYLRTRQGSGSVLHLPVVPGGRVDHLLTPAGSQPDDIDLTTTAAAAGPWLMEAYTDALSECAAYLPGVGYYPSGLPVLRELVADRFSERGLPTSADQILITSGALSSTAIAAQALGLRGSRVVIESPTYPNAIATLKGLGARLVPHPINHEAEGHQWAPAGLDLLLRQVRARSAYLVPDFHNPTGALMDATQRERVGALMRARGVVPIIDETPVELACDDLEMPPPLAAFTPDSITVGGVSKSFWGGLRIGWIRMPTARSRALADSRLRLDLGSPVLEQLAVAALLRRRAEIIAQRRSVFAAGRDVLLDGVAAHLPSWRVHRPPGGLSLWCRLPVECSTAMVATAAEHHLVLAAGPNFAPSGGLDQWMRLPFVLPPDRLADALPRLARAWDATLDAGPSTARHAVSAPSTIIA